MKEETNNHELLPSTLLPRRLWRPTANTSAASYSRRSGLIVSVLVDGDDSGAAGAAVLRGVDGAGVAAEAAVVESGEKSGTVRSWREGTRKRGKEKDEHLAANTAHTLPPVLVDDLVRVCSRDFDVGSDLHHPCCPAIEKERKKRLARLPHPHRGDLEEASGRWHDRLDVLFTLSLNEGKARRGGKRTTA